MTMVLRTRVQDSNSRVERVSFLERRTSHAECYRERPTIAAATAPSKVLNATLALMGPPEVRWLLLPLTMVVVPFDISVPARPIAPEVALRVANPTLAGFARKTVYTFLRNESPTTQVGFELLWPGMGDEPELSSRTKNAARQ